MYLYDMYIFIYIYIHAIYFLKGIFIYETRMTAINLVY